jgi:uncharacterized protein (DUF1778 family)
MAQTSTTSPRDQAINIRASRRQRDLIDRAAAALGKSRSDFMLEVACREAEDVLLDQVVFQVDEPTFAWFQELLDNPPAPSEKLIKLLNTKAPWDE